MLKDAELSLSDILQAKVHECSHVEAVSRAKSAYA